MARGSSEATGAAQSAQKLSDTYSNDAGGLFSTLSPMLSSTAAAPPGMAPSDLAATDTAAQQSAGGTLASVAGGGALKAARTRNAGGSDAAMAAGARTASEQLSESAVGTRLKNAALKNTQRESALKGLGGLFGDTATAGNQALGIVPSAVNANTQAENASWNWASNLLMPLLGVAGGNAKLLAGLGNSGGGNRPPRGGDPSGYGDWSSPYGGG